MNSVHDEQAFVREEQRTIQHQYIFADPRQNVFILAERSETTETT